jgi:hypothetical protein
MHVNRLQQRGALALHALQFARQSFAAASEHTRHLSCGNFTPQADRCSGVTQLQKF